VKPLKFLPAIAAALSLTACATIVSGTQQSLFVDTPHVEGAQCQLKDSKAGAWYLPSTPGTVTVLKGNGPMSIVCKKGGYETGVVSVDEDVSGATFGNILLGGGIGIFVDAASGAAQKYPDQVVVWMKPQHFASAAARKAWESDKADYAKKIAAELAAKKKTEQQHNNNG
jgi:hypothetical protein